MILSHRRVLSSLVCLCSFAALARAGGMEYPAAPTGDVVDDYHGTAVADPYRWLEDPDSDATKDWVQAENELTFAWLEAIPERDAIRKRLTELWDYPTYGTPERVGDRIVFDRNDGLQNQSVYYVQDSLDSEPRILIDPNTFSEDGTASLAGLSLSEDGRYAAYAKSTSGSDWREWFVRDIETGEDLDDHIQWAKFSGASWNGESTGFYYSRYDAPTEGDEYEETNKFQKLYFHQVGTPQSEDLLVYHRPDKEGWGFGGEVTDDGDYLLIYVWQGTSRKNAIYYKELSDPDAEVVELLPDFDASYSVVGNDGPRFYLQTDLDAPRGRLIAIDLTNPAPENWETLIEEQWDTLDELAMVNDQFVAHYMHHARSLLRIHDLDGSFEREIELPTLGTVAQFTGRREHGEAFYAFTSYLHPTTIFRYDFAEGESEVFHEPEVDFDASDYETSQVFYPSQDGTEIPMFLVHRKGLVKDGSNPTYLYGYGGFKISQKPYFSVSRLVWLEMGGVLAVANLRGGGEYGEDWHQAGMLKNKQNVFDDFIAAGEWLIDQGYTSTPKLAIAGGSNGGTLVGACLNQRPDLFGAALPAVGVMDMLRFHKFTIGWAWVSDYGSAEDPDMFPTLYAYSPYHNIRDGAKYPHVMVTTADHDDRVVPGHSFKYAARLQAAQGGDAPVMIRIQTKSGHGRGKPTKMRIEEATDVYGFLVRALDIRIPDMPGR